LEMVSASESGAVPFLTTLFTGYIRVTAGRYGHNSAIKEK
jgi:hypothetical protein